MKSEEQKLAENRAALRDLAKKRAAADRHSLRDVPTHASLEGGRRPKRLGPRQGRLGGPRAWPPTASLLQAPVQVRAARGRGRHAWEPGGCLFMSGRPRRSPVFPCAPVFRAIESGRLSVVHVQVDPTSTRISGSNYLQ